MLEEAIRCECFAHASEFRDRHQESSTTEQPNTDMDKPLEDADSLDHFGLTFTTRMPSERHLSFINDVEDANLSLS